jgi:hypothetical protein
MITIELNDGCSFKVDEQIVLNSTIESVFKDSLQYSKYDECIQLDMNFNEFSCIWMCHSVNQIIQPMIPIDEIRWRYIGLSSPEPPKPKYSQEDYIKYFTQNIIVDGRFTAKNHDTIKAHTQQLVKLNDKFDKYQPLIALDNNECYLPISYDIDEKLWAHGDNFYHGRCGYFKFYDSNDWDRVSPYTHKYRKEFDKLLAEIKSLGNFKEDKQLEEAFLKQFDYKKHHINNIYNVKRSGIKYE